MRGKLIELIIDGFRNCTKPHEACIQLDLEALADYLIAHGVTIETGGDLLPRETVINGVLMQMQASSSPVCMEEFLRNLDGVTLATDTNVGDKWIPVSERLPEDSGLTLVRVDFSMWDKKVNVPSLERYVNEEKAWFCDGAKLTNVTHWMPLPEAPKEVE